MPRSEKELKTAAEAVKLLLPKINEHRSLVDIALERIRNEILSGRLAPGDKIPQEQVAMQLGISRVPVREALSRLEAEGVVTLRPHVGFVVTKLTLEELEEMYATREIIEGQAIKLATERISDEEVARLEATVVELHQAAEAGDLARWLSLDREFHLQSYNPCGLRQLLRVISDFWNATQGYRRAYATLTGSMDVAMAAHSQILQAVQRRDACEAERVVREHIRETVRRIVANRDDIGL